jgi:hypothetical protein
MPLATPLGLADTVDHVERVQQARRHRHQPVDAAAALLEAREHQRPAGAVDALAR